MTTCCLLPEPGRGYNLPATDDVQNGHQPEHAQHIHRSASRRVCRGGKCGKSPPRQMTLGEHAKYFNYLCVCLCYL